jgi:hypothetical protein
VLLIKHPQWESTFLGDKMEKENKKINFLKLKIKIFSLMVILKKGKVLDIKYYL